MFKMIDTDNSGQITLEELKQGLERVGANLQDSEISGLMQAVSDSILSQDKFISLFLTSFDNKQKFIFRIPLDYVWFTSQKLKLPFRFGKMWHLLVPICYMEMHYS